MFNRKKTSLIVESWKRFLKESSDLSKADFISNLIDGVNKKVRDIGKEEFTTSHGGGILQFKINGELKVFPDVDELYARLSNDEMSIDGCIESVISWIESEMGESILPVGYYKNIEYFNEF